MKERDKVPAEQIYPYEYPELVEAENSNEKNVYDLLLKYPDWTSRQIGIKLDLSPSTVLKYKNKFFIKLDVALARALAGRFLFDYQMAGDAFRLQIRELTERIEKNEKKILVKYKDFSETKTVPLEPRDILDMERFRSELWKDIIFLCRQGEAVEIVKAIRDNIMAVNDSSSARAKPEHEHESNDSYSSHNDTHTLQMRES